METYDISIVKENIPDWTEVRKENNVTPLDIRKLRLSVMCSRLKAMALRLKIHTFRLRLIRDRLPAPRLSRIPEGNTLNDINHITDETFRDTQYKKGDSSATPSHSAKLKLGPVS